MRCLSLFFALVALSATATARPFTNTAGKTVEAEIVRATADQVTLRLKSKRTATIKISTLSDADQGYVRKWLAGQVPPLRVTPNMVRKTTTDSSYYSKNYQQNLELSVEFKNQDNAKGLEESTIKYFLIGRSLGKTLNYKVLLVQERDFEIEPGGKHTVRFRKAVNKYYDGSSYSSYYGNYKCIGYVLFTTRKKDQREVYSYASTLQLEEAIYSIVGLKTRDVVDENFQKPELKKAVIGEITPRDPRAPQRRPGQPQPTKKPAKDPIIIR